MYVCVALYCVTAFKSVLVAATCMASVVVFVFKAINYIITIHIYRNVNYLWVHTRDSVH